MKRSTFKWDILNHALQPRMELCTTEEVNDILKRYHIINKYNLPKMQSTDPVAQLLGGEKGGVVKIKRNGPQETGVIFRVII